MTRPATTATTSPAAMYIRVTAGPNRPHSSTIAISLTIGEAMRNAKVTPSGTPASTKPMNSGTAEQEQNGVTTPKPAAAIVPGSTPRPASADRTRSGDTYERRNETSVTIPVSSSRTLGTSYRKKATASPSCEPSCRPSRS